MARSDDRPSGGGVGRDGGLNRRGIVETLRFGSVDRPSKVRMEKVQRLRELIARGEYFVPASELAEKLAAVMWGRGALEQ